MNTDRTQEPTCGARYRALVESLFPQGRWRQGAFAELFMPQEHEPNPFAAYALGFMAGQAEKVASGSCHACMIRPGADWMRWAERAMRLICDAYDLVVVTDDAQGELWACRSWAIAEQVQEIRDTVPVNTAQWHRRRALLCGIVDIDEAYHTRTTYRVRCEPEEQP